MDLVLPKLKHNPLELESTGDYRNSSKKIFLAGIQKSSQVTLLALCMPGGVKYQVACSWKQMDKKIFGQNIRTPGPGLFAEEIFGYR
jgi:hypothetical protein